MSNENPESGDALPGWEDPAQMRRRLLWRMGIAGLMILALLGGLALFDYLAVEPDELEPAGPRFTEPVPVPPQSTTEALGSVVPAPEEESEVEAEASEAEIPEAPEASAVPEGAVVVEAAPPPANVTTPSPASVARSPSRRLAPAASSTVARPEAEEQRPSEVVHSRPEAGETETMPVIEAPQRAPDIPRQSTPALPELRSGYTLQAGVFSDPRRAEDIYARLSREGIPVTLETRVLVGPFNNQEEAESALTKMKAMGIDALPVAQNAKR
ncbi:MAG: SPOR domain-containing protein [Candidatus Accumulibacter sp.]|jgi:DedD protein|nr:SPOR domain-containing protein [Accumulibacter sp.]